MSGSLDFYIAKIVCPLCGLETEVNFCEDLTLGKDPETIVSIASGTADCQHCGAIITDKDLLVKPEIDYWPGH